jgi:hypothetical protein
MMDDQTQASAEQQAGSRLCSATTKDGQPCGALALRGQTTCLFHSASSEGLLSESRRRGGLVRSRALEPTSLVLRLDDAQGVRATIGDVLRLLAQGQIDRARADSIVAGCRALLSEFALGELQAQVDDLRAMIAAREGDSGI